MSSSAVLELYSLEDILDLNDVTIEEALDFLVTRGFIKLPEIQPLEFDD